MDWSEDAVVLGARPHGETAAILSVLTAGHGRHAGLVRGGQGRRLRGVLQPGNEIRVVWRARLPEHLGSFTVEPVRLLTGRLLDAPDRLAALAAAAAVTDTALPEREPHPALCGALLALLASLQDEPLWPAVYVRYELGLLAELGFALDLSACAATGETGDLAFVSPRTGRAVSAAAAQPYRDKLLACPPFLTRALKEDDEGVTWAHIHDGLRLTGFFLERQVYLHAGRHEPAARTRFVDRIARKATTSGVISDS